MVPRLLLLLLLALLPVPSRGGDADFAPIFNGKDLTNWDGNLKLWTVRDGVIRGETALPDRLALGNTFLLWRGGKLGDFELKLKVRIENGNSGVQYRCKDLGKWVVSGYQMEIDNAPGKAGFLYEEKARKYLAELGEKVEIDAQGKRRIVEQFAKKADLIAQGYYKAKDWNDYRIVARGPNITHWINGVKTIELTDLDPKGRALGGLLALQIHAGPPMVVEFKDILLKNL